MHTNFQTAAERHRWSIAQWRDNVRIVNRWDDPSLCKPREQCQQFTYTLVPLVGMSPKSAAQRALKAQEGFTKKLETLTRQQEKRAARAMKRTSK